MPRLLLREGYADIGLTKAGLRDGLIAYGTIAIALLASTGTAVGSGLVHSDASAIGAATTLAAAASVGTLISR